MGLLSDKRPHWSATPVFIGLGCFGAGFVLLGPLKLGFIRCSFLNQLPYALGGLALIALGNALVIVPTRTAMAEALGGEINSHQQAALMGMWVSVYALGGITGAVLGPALLTLRSSFLCAAGEEHGPCYDGMCTCFFVLFGLYATLAPVVFSTYRHLRKRKRGTGLLSAVTPSVN